MIVPRKTFLAVAQHCVLEEVGQEGVDYKRKQCCVVPSQTLATVG